jgi:hypothetical protein
MHIFEHYHQLCKLKLDRLASPSSIDDVVAEETGVPVAVKQDGYSCKEITLFNLEYVASAVAGIALGREAVEHIPVSVLSPGLSLFAGDLVGFYSVNLALRYLEKFKEYSAKRGFASDFYRLAATGAVVGVASSACRILLTDYLSKNGLSNVAAADIAQIPSYVISIAGFNVGWFYGDWLVRKIGSALKGT